MKDKGRMSSKPQMMANREKLANEARARKGKTVQRTLTRKTIPVPPGSPNDNVSEGADLIESEDDLSLIDPSLLGQAVVFGTDWTAATLIDQLRRENVKLDPIFQRRNAWDSKRKSRLIESIVLGLPIPQTALMRDRRSTPKRKSVQVG